MSSDKTPAQPAPTAAPSEPAKPVAWHCVWKSHDQKECWDQYHDENDPLPSTWEDPPTTITPLYATPPARLHAPLSDEHPYTYASTQATKCAGCGEYKHTPLRIDAMGGYVCLTCIDKKLGVVLGEFGYPAPQEPLSDEQIAVLVRDFYAGRAARDNTPEAIVRAVERAHGIGITAIGASNKGA